MRLIQRPLLRTLTFALLCTASVLVGPFKVGGQILPDRLQKANAGATAGIPGSPDGVRQMDEASGSERRAQVRPPHGEEEETTKQKLHSIVRQIQADPTGEEEEPLIVPDALQPNIGIPLVFNEAVDHYIRYFTTTKKDLFKRWLKRKRRYAPLVRQILKEHNLPEDLVYLAMIESGFNLLAYSPMKAAGPWQFIPETGRRYGLTVNHWIDERRDIRKSTIAAARYLQDLFGQFGCWYLAAAGYNAGENRIDRLIKKYDTKDFWELRAYNTLPRETREYVPQLIAAAIIAKDPAKYGLGDIEHVPPFEFVTEKVPGGVPLEIVAKAASIDLPSVKTLNPEIRRGITPPGKDCRIKLPADTDGSIFQRSLLSLLEQERKVVGVIQYTVKGQDNVSRIARTYRVSREDLVLVNGSPLSLKKGLPVYIPKFEGAEQEEEPAPAKTADFKKDRSGKAPHMRANSPKSPYHVVRKGETLSSIARKHGMELAALKRINRLKTSHVQRGMRLSILETSASSPPIDKKNAKAVGNSRPKAKEATASYTKKPSQKAVKRYHTVRKGETLSGIAAKYGKNIESLREINGLRGNRVQQGMRLRISFREIGEVHSSAS
ncbi:MAG TPA: lytic transglycosylase [Deltaproteobacteria bacterium]|nr:lytic transglycosylase [Deltaproteobacteria bacterium]